MERIERIGTVFGMISRDGRHTKERV